MVCRLVKEKPPATREATLQTVGDHRAFRDAWRRDSRNNTTRSDRRNSEMKFKAR